MSAADQDDQIVFELESSSDWLQVPLDGVDPLEWATATVEQLVAGLGRQVPPAEQQIYQQTYAEVAVRARARAASEDETLVGTYLLLAEGDAVPVVSADLVLEPVDPEQGVDDLVEALMLPPSQRFGDPVVDELDTRSGPAVRIRQLGVVGPAAGTRDSGAGDDDADDRVVTLVVVVWPGPLHGLATLLTATFGSPVDAELHAASVDDLAAGLRVTREPAR